MSMLSTGRPTRPEQVITRPATLTGAEGLLQHEPLIFELGGWDKTGVDLPPVPADFAEDDLGDLLRVEPIGLPGLSEPETVRHYVRLSQQNHAIALALYPLGSCTMKHNPRLNEKMARLPGFADIHPLQPVSTVQGALQLIDELAHWLKTLTGLPAVAMTPKAGAHGELCGILAITAAHRCHRRRPSSPSPPPLQPCCGFASSLSFIHCFCSTFCCCCCCCCCCYCYCFCYCYYLSAAFLQ